MATRQQNKVAYGLTDALLGVPNFPLQAKRAPTTSDKAMIGTLWIDTVGNDAYVLTSLAGGSSTWVGFNDSDTFTSLTVDPGNITVTDGNVDLTLGDVNVAAGDINVTLGNITADAGNIEATLGSLAAGTTVTAGTTITAGTGITSTTGNIAASAGNVTAGGSMTATTTVTGITGIRATSGGVIAAAGDVRATLGSLYAGGDNAGVALQTAITNGTNTTQGVGVGTVLLTAGTSRNNTGFLKFYVGVTAVYVPYFADIS